MLLNKQECINRYNKVYAIEPQGMGATRSMLMRLLRSQDLVGWNTHEESGRLDKKAFTRFAVGNNAVFSKRTHVDAEKSAVSILIDCSGSMHRRIKLTQEVVIQLAKLLEKARVDFCINGFQDGKSSRAWGKVGVGADRDMKSAYTVHPTFIPFKTWGESLAKASPKIGAIDQCADNGTPDYASVANAITDIARRPEHKKILFIVTDADGYDVDSMKHLQDVADKSNVRIVAIGIGETDVKDCFKHAEDVKNLKDLGDVAFKQLLKGVK